MIILSEAKESKIASATSTYPALIVKVSDSGSSIMKRLQFYCPTTMSGLPKDALFATNNWVDAPTYPHNGAEPYDFQPGGVIIISYADGNLNSPQFVRWLKVSDEVRETNYGYILGNTISVEGDLLSIWDDHPLTSLELQKAVMLLDYVGIAAGMTNDYIREIRLSGEYYYAKCSKYGIEVITDDIGHRDRLESNWDYLYNITQRPTIGLDNICQYLIDKDPQYVISTVNSIILADKISQPILKNDTTVLYLYQMLAGYADFEKGGQVINSKIYNEDEDKRESELKALQKQAVWEYIKNGVFYNKLDYPNTAYPSIYNKFIKDFWRFFSKDDYEIKRICAIRLTNNLFKLKAMWNVESLASSITLVACAIIATAYPSLEYYILHPGTVTDERAKLFLNNLSKINIEGYYGLASNYDFSDLLFSYVLKQKPDWDKDNQERKNMNIAIKTMLDKLQENWSSISYKLGETLTTPGATTTPSQPTPTPGTSKFAWPLPGFSTISSPYGWRVLEGKSQFHNGVDIAKPGVYGSYIVAAADGKVVYSKLSKSAGEWIYIDHGNGFITEYMHGIKGSRQVFAGDKVKKGQRIMRVNSTGYSTGNHLHFGMKHNGEYVNPLDHVKYGDS